MLEQIPLLSQTQCIDPNNPTSDIVILPDFDSGQCSNEEFVLRRFSGREYCNDVIPELSFCWYSY